MHCIGQGIIVIFSYHARFLCFFPWMHFVAMCETMRRIITDYRGPLCIKQAFQLYHETDNSATISIESDTKNTLFIKSIT